MPGAFAEPQVYAGGVAGIQDLLIPSNSYDFRRAGGGLYLHNTGWSRLTEEQQRTIIDIFRGSPVAVELGFGSGAAWGRIYQTRYLAYGIRPNIIMSNAFSNNHMPTLDEWHRYAAGLREHGVPDGTLILPTFEYQNFGVNIPSLAAHMVSQWRAFEDIDNDAGGLALDTPSEYAMRREPAYRDWVVDAIRWSTAHRLTSVVILSPGSSGTRWPSATAEYLEYLSSAAALPSAFVCENYRDAAPADYPNKVGNSAIPYTTIGQCLALKASRFQELEQIKNDKNERQSQ